MESRRGDAAHLNVWPRAAREAKRIGGAFTKIYVRAKQPFARTHSFNGQPAVRLLVVVLKPEVRDEVFAAQVAERVLELHQLDEDVVLWVEAGRGHRRLEVEGEPLLRALHADALREVQEEREV